MGIIIKEITENLGCHGEARLSKQRTRREDRRTDTPTVTMSVRSSLSLSVVSVSVSSSFYDVQ